MIVRLAVPGVVRGVLIDTSHFTGNYPPYASVEAATLLGYPSADRAARRGLDPAAGPAGAGRRHRERLPGRSPPTGWPATSGCGSTPTAASPGCGCTASRSPDPRFLGGRVDLAAAVHGGRILGCSNRFYSSPANVLAPGRVGGDVRRLGERPPPRRRQRLDRRWGWPVPACCTRWSIDTSRFVGNAPGAARLSDADTGEELLPRTPLLPDTEHRFKIGSSAAVRRVRLDVYPDGGISRLRVLGELDRRGPRRAGPPRGCRCCRTGSPPASPPTSCSTDGSIAADPGLAAELAGRAGRCWPATTPSGPAATRDRPPGGSRCTPPTSRPTGSPPTPRGSGARRRCAALAEHGPLPGFDAAEHDAVRAKLAREPIEDLRIDFEDGYGTRPDDGGGRRTPVAPRRRAGRRCWTDGHRCRAFTGLRIKSLEPAYARARAAHPGAVPRHPARAGRRCRPASGSRCPRSPRWRRSQAMVECCAVLESRARPRPPGSCGSRSRSRPRRPCSAPTAPRWSRRCSRRGRPVRRAALRHLRLQRLARRRRGLPVAGPPGRRPRQGGDAGRGRRTGVPVSRRLDQRAAGRRHAPPSGPPGSCTPGWSGARWNAASTRAGTCTRPSCPPGTPPPSGSSPTGWPRRRPGWRPTGSGWRPASPTSRPPPGR